jgi:hypothetical protein
MTRCGDLSFKAAHAQLFSSSASSIFAASNFVAVSHFPPADRRMNPGATPIECTISGCS